MEDVNHITTWRRMLLNADPFHPGASSFDHVEWRDRGSWPGGWVSHPSCTSPPFVMAYRLTFSFQSARTVRIHVSADERYTLYLGGVLVGRGPERCDARHWVFETYDITMPAGAHTFLALVWSLGALAPAAQASVRHGFLMVPQETDMYTVLGTGGAPWQAAILAGRQFMQGPVPGFVGAMEAIDASRWPWTLESDGTVAWVPAVRTEAPIPCHRLEIADGRHPLVPASLPPMMSAVHTNGRLRHLDDHTPPPVGDPASARTASPIQTAEHLAGESAPWQAWLDGHGTVTVPPNTVRRAIMDLDDYVCAYPDLVVNGGRRALICLEWAESLFSDTRGDALGQTLGRKEDRSAINGKFWFGFGDRLVCDGGPNRHLAPLWWRCGRYISLSIRTYDEPLTLQSLTLCETRYPLEQECRFVAPIPDFMRIWPILVRTIQACAHETYLDCPYYEQLMYAGDTRLAILTTYALTRDTRLPRKAITAFAGERLPSGLLMSRTPTRFPQVIPTWTLWWVTMVRDYAWWRDDRTTVKALMPDVRCVMETFAACCSDDGMLYPPPGWNMVDWVWDPNWRDGVPPDGGHRCNAALQWQWILTIQSAADLEDAFGEPELASRYRRMESVARKAAARFWSDRRNLFAEDLDHAHFSEHANALALVAGGLPAQWSARLGDALFASENLPRASLYFSHYLIEAARAANRPLDGFERLADWYDLPRRGLFTIPECPEPTRSDCHGWGTHPLFHAFATILGIRPAAPGFTRVRIEPLLGDLTHASGRIPHPRGEIAVHISNTPDSVEGTITLPDGVTGTFAYRGLCTALTSGANPFSEHAHRIHR
jgi:hypothetical protein